MLNKYGIILDNEISYDIGVSIISRPSIPAPTRQYIEKEVRGKDGKLYEDLGTYEDIDIPIKCNFASRKPDEWNDIYRQIKKWIKNKSKLRFSDDLSYFYVINKITIDSSERAIKRIGRFNLIINCKPFMYLESGLEDMPIATSIYNAYEAARPIYFITGEGVLTLTINNVTVTVNVGQNLIINTEKGLCYRTDGTMNNIALKGKYKDLYLKEGENTFSWTSGFKIEIVPNWRTL